MGSIQNRYAGKGYAEFKRNLAEVIIDFLKPIQARYTSLAADPAMLAEVLHRGARNARERSAATLVRVYRGVGFVPGAWGHRRRVGGRGSSSERQLEIALPAAPWAFHERRGIMETKETKDVTAAAAAAADAELECMTDCCDCFCCDTEEECSIED